MSGYTHRNLQDDVADSAERFGLSPQLEAHFAGRELGLTTAGLSFQRLAPDTRGPFGHRHATQEEVYVIVGGSGRIKLGDEVRELRQWDAVRVAPETMRCFESGPDGLELLAYGAPPTGMDDVEMAPGWWQD